MSASGRELAGELEIAQHTGLEPGAVTLAIVSLREVAAASVGFAAVVVLQLVAVRGKVVLNGPLTLDEVHTFLLASRQGFLESLRSLAAGADYSPPLLYPMYRVVAHVAGGLTPLIMRVLSMLFVWGACVAVYLVLRQAFDRTAAAAGMLAVWANHLVIGEAFDARFYGPWMLFTALFAFALSAAPRSRRPRLCALGIAAAAVATCTIHYFGVFSWAAAVAAAWIADPARAGAKVQRYSLALSGPIALAVCFPFYVGQRAALTMATWMPDPTVTGTIVTAIPVIVTPPVLVALIAWAVARAKPGGAMRVARPSGPFILLAQVGVAVVVGAFSLVVQPATQPRYFIVAALAAGPIVAWCCARLGRSASRAMVLITIVWSSVALSRVRSGAAAHAQRFADDVSAVSAVAGSGVPVIVASRHQLYPMLVDHPEWATRLTYLDQTDTGGSALRYHRVERDVARVHQRIYGFPEIVSVRTLNRDSVFYLVEDPPVDVAPPGSFSGYRLERIGQRMRRAVRN